jgi:hypothetical protein
MLVASATVRAFEFLAHPFLESDHVVFPAKKIAHQIIGR